MVRKAAIERVAALSLVEGGLCLVVVEQRSAELDGVASGDMAEVIRDDLIVIARRIERQQVRTNGPPTLRERDLRNQVKSIGGGIEVADVEPGRANCRRSVVLQQQGDPIA